MSWRIEKIEIENFKFFSIPFCLNLGGKNLLLFGENGAGKSSIYWSCYTHFQAAGKSDVEAAKYFNPNHSENLRNRYCTADKRSGIKISFSDGNAVTHSYDDSSDDSYLTNPDAKNFMKASALSSDFLNYKLISKLFDFPNSAENNVFETFKKEVFPLLNFLEAIPDVTGQPLSSSNVESSWNYINNFENFLPRNAKKPGTFNQKSPEYIRFKSTLKAFDIQIKLLLNFIQNKANEILEKSFFIPVKLEFDYKAPKFNEIIEGTRKSRTGRLLNPKILLHASFDATGVVDKSKILHPKSFFNEAKITCMGIAVRLAALAQREVIQDGAGVLFIDDMLISLDMSVRKLVIPIILEYAKRWQLLIFTHDRSLFFMYQKIINSIKEKLEEKIEEASDEEERQARIKEYNAFKEWKCIELYSTNQPDQIPKPILIENATHLERAIRNFNEFRIPECANSLRRACEQILKRILPTNYLFQVTNDYIARDMKDLDGMLKAFKKLAKECKIAPFKTVFADLDMDRKLILNPFSHDDLDTPFYRSELKRIIDHLKYLNLVEKKSLVSGEKLNKTKYKIRVTKVIDGTEVESWVNFKFLEHFDVIIIEGVKYHTNPRVEVLDKSERITEIDKDDKIKLSKVCARIRHDLLPIEMPFAPDVIEEI